MIEDNNSKVGFYSFAMSIISIMLIGGTLVLDVLQVLYSVDIIKNSFRVEQLIYAFITFSSCIGLGMGIAELLSKRGLKNRTIIKVGVFINGGICLIFFVTIILVTLQPYPNIYIMP